MGKSVYSIVLNDAVVDAIDQMAYRLGTNRSNMINQILAEKVSFVTPEQKIKNILSNVENLIDSNIFQIMLPSGDSSLMMKSSFKYKYNPSVKYSVVLNKTGGEAKGELRVNFRTQNTALLNELASFLEIWTSLENHYLKIKPKYSIGAGKFTRELRLPDKDYDDRKSGKLISDYINAFDGIMKFYFQGAEPVDVEKKYIDFIKGCEYAI
ncbi:MAG: hypothetical protein ACI4VF_09395 [Lachnospirales bacterium]